MRSRVHARLLTAALLAACGTTAPPEDVADPPTAAATPPPTAVGGADADPPPAPTADSADESPGESPADPPTPTLPDDYLHFDRACEPGTRITIAAVGDLLLHRELQKQAFKAKDRYLNLWSGVVDLLQRADLTYANLEGPASYGINRKGELVEDPGMVFDNQVYSGYARFNYHPSLAKDLRKSGIDIVSTANNHALDRGSLGVDRTLEALDKARIKHTGTIKKDDEPRWYSVTKTDGIRIAWIACTLHANYVKDEHGQVLYCFKRRPDVAKMVAKLAKNPRIDAVIVTPHFGGEYEQSPRERQIEFAHKVLDAGATAVIGSHPHVLQPWERYDTPDGRQTLIMYSLGNFASHQRSLPRRTSMILHLGLTKTDDGQVFVNGVRYVPTHVRMVGKKAKFFVEAIDRVGGPADARALTLEMFGTANLMAPDDPIVTQPHCDPAWVPPTRKRRARSPAKTRE